MRRAATLAAIAFGLVWLPLSVWKGLSAGRTFRLGAEGQAALSPLLDAVIQAAAVMLVPALFAALAVFTLVAWIDERRGR